MIKVIESEEEYRKAVEILHEDFTTGLSINPLHSGKDPKDADWQHWKEITRLLQSVCKYEIKHGIYPGYKKGDNDGL
jgi:hypothetical protein